MSKKTDGGFIPLDTIVSPKTVTVCDKCLQASCWQGIFMCDEAQFAGTVEKTIDELKALNLEHSDYWKKG